MCSSDLTATAPSISGSVFEDYNNDAVFNTFESGVTAGGFVYLDANNDGIYQAGEQTASLGANGYYAFPTLANGTYFVRSELTGWTRTTPSDVYVVTLNSSSDFSIDNNFGYGKDNRFYGFVYDDRNANGVLDGSERPLEG